MRIPEPEIAREIAYRHALFVVFGRVFFCAFGRSGFADSHIDRHRAVGLERVNKIIERRDVPAVDGLVPCAVEPQLADLAVLSAEQSAQMRAHIFCIFFVVVVAGLVPVPERIIEPEFYSVFLAGFRDLGNNICRIFRVVDAVFRRVGIEKTKAVVVLRYENDIVHARLVCVSDPAVRIYRVGRVAVERQSAVRPLGVVECVDAEMDEHSVFAGYLRFLRGVRLV